MRYPIILRSELWKGQVIPHGGDTYQMKITKVRTKTMNEFRTGDKVFPEYLTRYGGLGSSIYSVPANTVGEIVGIGCKDGWSTVSFNGIELLMCNATLKHKYPEHPRRRFSLAKYIYHGMRKSTSSIVMAQQIKLWAFVCDGLEAEWAGTEEAGQYQVRHPESGCCYRVEPEWCWGIQEEDSDDN